MQSVLRVGAVAAVVGCLAAYGLARVSGLVVVYGILLLGFGAGVAMAKWLDWSLYGHQLESGAQAGAIACVPAGAVALVALLSQDTRSVANLEAASHLGPLSAAGVAHAFAFAGWVGADAFSVLFSTLFAIGLAALAAIVVAWSKSGRAVHSVSQAYEAARSLRAGAWSAGTATAVPAMQGATTTVPAWQPAQQTGGPRAESGFTWQTSAQPAIATTGPYAPPVHSTFPPLSQNGSQPVPPANSPANDDELRAAMREALAMWGDESGEHEAPDPSNPSAVEGAPQSGTSAETKKRSRQPQASQFLNDKKKRGRKKEDTRDWLC